MKTLLRHAPSRYFLLGIMAVFSLTVFGCDSKSGEPAAASTVAPPLQAASASAAAPPTTSQNQCAQAMAQLRRCHQNAVAGGKLSAAQIAQSATYLRRLDAWWQMDGSNPAIQAACSAIAAEKDSCTPDGDVNDTEDSGMTEAHFNRVMKQFDEAGVPR